MGEQAEQRPRDARLSLQPFTVYISERNAGVPHLGALERESLNVTETFATWKTTLANDLMVLTQLRGSDDMRLMQHAMKEQDIRLYCYQAEENLTDAELALLKKVLRLSELRWCAYTSKLRPGQAYSRFCDFGLREEEESSTRCCRAQHTAVPCLAACCMRNK
jgi:hypothetical protein